MEKFEVIFSTELVEKYRVLANNADDAKLRATILHEYKFDPDEVHTERPSVAVQPFEYLR